MNKKLAVLISGRGSNLKAILDFKLPVSCIISDNPDAEGLKYARSIKTIVVDRRQENFHKKLLSILNKEKPDLIALAGFMSILPLSIVSQFNIINIHPSLLPEFKGLNTHKRFLSKYRDNKPYNYCRFLFQQHGCTVHWVNENVDDGKIIDQRDVGVVFEDTENTLAAKVLEAEHKLYPKTIKKVLKSV